MTGGTGLGFTFQIIIWLCFTVMFANFAEAVAEGRGKAQAVLVRRPSTETQAKKLSDDDRTIHPRARICLKVGDLVLVEAGDISRQTAR